LVVPFVDLWFCLLYCFVTYKPHATKTRLQTKDIRNDVSGHDCPWSNMVPRGLHQFLVCRPVSLYSLLFCEILITHHQDTIEDTKT
jgi:hypothetical protein